MGKNFGYKPTIDVRFSFTNDCSSSFTTTKGPTINILQEQFTTVSNRCIICIWNACLKILNFWNEFLKLVGFYGVYNFLLWLTRVYAPRVRGLEDAFECGMFICFDNFQKIFFVQFFMCSCSNIGLKHCTCWLLWMLTNF